MSEPNTRKPLRIVHDDVQAEDRPWRVRTKDGQVRGPLNVAALRSLVEIGIVTPEAVLSSATEENWTTIGQHPLWNELRPSTKQFMFRNAELVEEVVKPHVSPADVAVRQEKLERMEAVKLATLRRTERGLAYWQIGHGLRAFREVLVFFAFLTFGDVMASFFGDSQGLAKGGVFMCLTAVALTYYAFRAMEK